MEPHNKLPELSHLQFVVLGALLAGDRSGKQVRKVLRSLSVLQSGPSFYQMMARLEDAGFVKGRYERAAVGEYVVKERHYSILEAGRAAWSRSREFYLKTISQAEEGGLAHG